MSPLKKPNRILNSLIKNYIFFSLTLTIVVFVLSTFLYIQTKTKVVDPVIPKLKASEIVRPDYTAIPTDVVEMFHGSVKILDERLHVIYSKGENADRKDSYSNKELVEMLYDRKNASDYASLAPFQTAKGKTYYCLIQIPDSQLVKDVKVNTTPAAQKNVIVSLLLQVVIAFLLLFALNVYLYSKRLAVKMSNPLSKIAAGMQRMADGEYGTRVTFKAYDELECIQEMFNLMAEKLERAEQEKMILEESKRRMLVGISHDLKTPITTIQGYAKALQLGLATDEEKRQRYLYFIMNKADRVTDLIDDVFELSKLESPDYPMSVETADFAEFVREITTLYYDQFEEKQLSLHLDIPERLMLSFHAKLMDRVVSNLISNALKYTPAGGEITLQLHETEAHIEFVVANDGPGIPDDQKTLIFEPFFRGDQARNSDGGSGLGLSIAKHAVMKHGGELRLDTDSGKTAFRIIFIRKAQAPFSDV